MRELTEYEKDKWLDQYGRFLEMEESDFLLYGDELGEAFTAVFNCTNMPDYGLSDEFVQHAIVQTLDLYYDQFYTIYIDGYDDPEDHSLPSGNLLIEKAKELGIDNLTSYYGNTDDDTRKLWDWAMEWRREHFDEIWKETRIKQLKDELESLEAGDTVPAAALKVK